MPLKAGQAIGTLDHELLGKIVTHTASRDCFYRIIQLIEWLRSCQEPSDYYEFQRHLFGDVYRVEERRADCTRIVKRLRQGKSLPADAPAPPEDGDPSGLETWEREVFVCERLARQLRSVGDGLAWRCFGYDRRIVLTLSRNDSPGPMSRKDGLGYELGRVEELWKESGHFALLHDLSNCLRIADLTEFTSDGGRLLREMKSTPHTDAKQLARIQLAIDAIMNGGPLPGNRPDARLVELTEPYVTNLNQLHDLIQLAKQHGCRGMKLDQGRALVASSLPAMHNRWGDSMDKGLEVFASTKQRAIKRAGITGATHHVRGISGDTSSRSPMMAPWSIYPFAPDDCAALICDQVIFETTLAPEYLIASLAESGVTAELLLLPKHGSMAPNQDVIRARWRDRAMTLHAPGLSLLLYELVEPDTWARGIAEALKMSDPPAEPVLVFAREAGVWEGVNG
jgi:hypothetical protein